MVLTKLAAHAGRSELLIRCARKSQNDEKLRSMVWRSPAFPIMAIFVPRGPKSTYVNGQVAKKLWTIRSFQTMNARRHVSTRRCSRTLIR